jgi:photosystem II stability/assembly factor-like uncharacterized protein
MTYRSIFLLVLVCATLTLHAQSWEPLGPYGPRTVYKVAESDSALLILCYVADGPRLYRSEDKGKTWEASADDNINIDISNIDCVDNVFYAVTFYSDVYMSVDQGRTWVARNRIKTGTTNLAVGSILGINNSLYIGWGDKYYNSNDSGLTYFLQKAKVDGEMIKSAIINDNIVTITKSGVYLSNDRAGSWKTITPTFAADDSDGRDLAVLGNTIYVSTYRHVYYSTDMGATWGVSNEFTQGRTYIRVAGYASRLWVAADSSLYYTSDRFATMMQATMPRASRFTWTLIPTRNGLLLSSYEGGAYLTFDTAKTWMLLEKNFTTRLIYNIWANDNVLMTGTSTGMLLRSTNNGSSWEKSFQSTLVHAWGNQFKATFILGDSLYTAIDENDQLIATNDYGASWHINGKEQPWTNVSDIAVNDSVWIAIAGQPIRSADKGNSWAYMNRQGNLELQQLTFHGGSFFAPSIGGYICHAAPTALNFVRDTNDLPLSPYYAIASNGKTLFVGGDSGNVYRSRDSGASWQKMNIPSNFSIRDIKCYGENVIMLAPVGSVRVYFSPNEGDTIITLSPNNFDSYYSAEVAINDKYLFVQTSDKGIFRYNYLIPSVVRSNEKRSQFTLYPNPTQTVVNITAPEKANAEVHLIDMLGREVCTGRLSDEGKLTLEVTELANGIYTIMLEHNGVASFEGKIVVAK